MKWLTYFLSFYMLLLSCMPCGDSSDCNEEENVTMVSSGTHDDHDKDAEHCTPFCVCACCAAPAVQFQQVIVIKDIPAGRSLNEYPAECIFSTLHHNIWQPPRLS